MSRTSRPPAATTPVAGDEEPGVGVGRFGDRRIFTCPADHRHAFEVDLH